MICDRLGSIEFWFDFVWLDMPGMFDTMLAKYFVGQEAVGHKKAYYCQC